MKVEPRRARRQKSTALPQVHATTRIASASTASTSTASTSPASMQGAHAPVPSAAHASARLQRFVEADVAGERGLHATSLLDLRAHAEDESLDVVFKKNLIDFRTAFGEIRKQPPSVVFFGGARLKPDDKYWQLAEGFGRALATYGIPPKTGRGPGAMHAVPAAFIEARDASVERVIQSVVDGVSRLSHIEDQRTLGFNIKLPKEQSASPAVENGSEIQNFAYRKFALYENVRGVVVLPGGFGTIDELMEVLVLRANGKSRDPVVLAGADYWQPILDALKSAAKRNGADLLVDLLDGVMVTDDPAAGMKFIAEHIGVRSFDSDPDAMYTRTVRELKLAKYVSMHQERAVTVLGGNRLSKTDPALAVIAEIARRVDGPIRVGEDGQVATLIAENTADLQRVLWGDVAASSGKRSKPDVDHVTFSERIPHKEVLLRNSSAYLVLPDAGRGKDELCSVLCQIQTGKIPRKPMILVDSAYWKPIVNMWKQQMVGEGHAYIAAEDVDLLTFADTADEAMAALT